jgi:murein DD-endopeptidase MepM/ murein hydrolase activator NlpD
MFQRFVIILSFILCVLNAQAQEPYPADYFRAPLDIPMVLSGNFGELRSNHFHAGIDIKTQGVIGHKVYAAAEGYISRIKIEAAGYGNTLYITHPAGYTTVYGHLDRFRSDIADYVRNIQYERQTHALYIYPEKDRWTVAKGDFIAFSGTSGYSFGPHLHFEIRDAARQEPMNVLLFGFDIRDDVPPDIYSLFVYPRSRKGLVNRSGDKQRFTVQGKNGSYRLKGIDTLRLNGEIGFGIEAYDYLNGARNRCGLYSLQVMVDSGMVFHWVMDRFSFSKSRFINSYIDYEEKGKNKRSVQKTFVEPNNHLRLYRYVENSGILDFSEKKTYELSFVLADAHGNQSVLNFTAEGGSLNEMNGPLEEPPPGVQFSCRRPNLFSIEGVEMELPEGALYDDIRFTYTREESRPGTFSPVHHLQDPYTPLHLACDLRIKTEGLPDSLREKAVLAMLTDEGEMVSAGGEWTDGWVSGTVREFGSYTITVDTVPPLIRPLNVQEDMSGAEAIRFRIADELSGIQSYQGYVDNEWALFEYDLKNDLVFYTFDPTRITRGVQHEIELYIIDNKDNISYYYTELYW